MVSVMPPSFGHHHQSTSGGPYGSSLATGVYNPALVSSNKQMFHPGTFMPAHYYQGYHHTQQQQQQLLLNCDPNNNAKMTYPQTKAVVTSTLPTQYRRKMKRPAPTVDSTESAATATKAPRIAAPVTTPVNPAPQIQNNMRVSSSVLKPLFVDCSVEYELPGIAKVPKDSQPLLKIDHRFRSNNNFVSAAPKPTKSTASKACNCADCLRVTRRKAQQQQQQQQQQMQQQLQLKKQRDHGLYYPQPAAPAKQQQQLMGGSAHSNRLIGTPASSLMAYHDRNVQPDPRLVRSAGCEAVDMRIHEDHHRYMMMKQNLLVQRQQQQQQQMWERFAMQERQMMEAYRQSYHLRPQVHPPTVVHRGNNVAGCGKSYHNCQECWALSALKQWPQQQSQVAPTGARNPVTKDNLAVIKYPSA